MSTVNLMAREVSAKIVFYGPGLSGKTTTLRRIHESVKPAHRGELMSLPTETDRTLFFDFLPVRVERVGDCAVRLALYTVPGQVFYNATRKLVLQGADGVVFVADSQPAAMDSNVESLKNLEENLAEQGVRLDQFPLVLQFNKRDLSNVLSVEHMRASLNALGVPDFETSATNGQGIFDTLKTITRLVIRDLRAKRIVPPPRSTAATPAVPELAAHENGELEDQIQQHLATRPPPDPGEEPTPAEGTALPIRGAVTPEGMGPAAALAPTPLFDYARSADLAFAQGDFDGCVRACQEGVRRALAFAGDETLAAQGFFLGLWGPDLLRLQGLSAHRNVRVDDAAFGLYVFMQVLVRLAHSGIFDPEH